MKSKNIKISLHAATFAGKCQFFSEYNFDFCKLQAGNGGENK